VQALLERRLEADDSYLMYRRAAIRVRAGKPLQDGVPEPQSGKDPTLSETWDLEREVSERLGRQYRCICDACLEGLRLSAQADHRAVAERASRSHR